MLDDNVFGILVFVLGALVVINKALSEYGYEKAVSDARNIFVLLIIFVIIAIVLFLILKANIKKIVNWYQTRHPFVITKEIIVEKLAIQIEEEIPEPLLPEKEPVIEDINITIDKDKRFFWFNKLDKHEVEYLKNKKYIVRTYVNPFKKQKETFVFKPYANEGAIHAFIVLLIAHYLNDKVDNMTLYATVKPDIVFELNGKKCAIEVETGKIYQHNRQQLFKKIHALNKEYDKWIFVVTNKNYVARYRKYGRVIDTRYLKTQLNSFLDEA